LHPYNIFSRESPREKPGFQVSYSYYLLPSTDGFWFEPLHYRKSYLVSVSVSLFFLESLTHPTLPGFPMALGFYFFSQKGL